MALAAAFALIVVLVAAYERRQLLAAVALERDSWREERAELLTRIQRPAFIPPQQRREPTEPPEPRDLAAYQRVGVVAPLRDPSEN